MAQIDKPNLHFNTKLYSGNGSTNAITGVGFAPDFVWIKERTSTSSHVLGTTIQGTGKRVSSNTTDAEASLPNIFTSFDSDGFTHGADNGVNESGQTYVSWNWLANGTASSNTDGSITSTVSANTTAGFSIVKYTGTGSNATVGHGLGAVPKMIFFKVLDSATNWVVYHVGVGNTGALRLNLTNATQTTSVFFQDTTPSSSIITIGTGTDLNTSSQSVIAYCFAEKKGFSKFGSYAGNGNADGTFVYTGFKPALVIFKATSGTESWSMVDNKRDTDNVVKNQLFPNLSASEETTNNVMDFCSNGFKMRNSDSRYNSSGTTYIYMAFAENPLVGTNNIPATAR